MRITYSGCPHTPQCEHSQRGKCIARQAKDRKRAKHVYNTGQLPHLWFHKVQGSARNAQGNLYFQNETIYSYGSHFPIARHVTRGKKSAVLMTTRTYSVTTSGHCSAVRCAIPSGVLVFHVPNVFTSDTYASNDHASNLSDYVKRVDTCLGKCARARQSYTKEWSHGRAVELRAESREYAKFFKLALPKIAPIPDLDSNALKAIKAKEAQKSAQKAAEEKARKAELAKQEKELADKWRKGEVNQTLYNTPPMLRLSPDKSEVQTSLGARVPVASAIALLDTVRKVVARGERFVSNGHSIHIGAYKVDSIEVNGELHAGCHVVSFQEIERLAPELEALTSTAA